MQAVVCRPPSCQLDEISRCSLKESIQTHASSSRGRRCSVAQASSNHPRWYRPHPVCLSVALALDHGVYPSQKSIFAIFRASSLGIVLSLQYRALNPAACLLLGKTSQVKSDNVSDVPPVCYHLPAQGLVRLPYFLPTHSATVLHHSTFAALVPLEDCWWNLSALCALALLVIPVHSLKHNVHQLSVDPRGCARRDNCLLPTETS